MITILIFSILNSAKFPKGIALQWMIAIPVAFLSTAYIAPGEIFSILTTYSALGIALSVILPFVILLFGSSMLLSYGGMSVGKVILQFFLWLIYLVILFYKIIAGFVSGEVSTGLNITFIILLTILVATLIILLANKKFRLWFYDIGLELRRIQHAYELHNARYAQQLAEAVENGRGPINNPITGKFERT